jgi:hypothetical protein
MNPASVVPGNGIRNHASQNEIAAPTQQTPAIRATELMSAEASIPCLPAKCIGSLRAR